MYICIYICIYVYIQTCVMANVGHAVLQASNGFSNSIFVVVRSFIPKQRNNTAFSGLPSAFHNVLVSTSNSTRLPLIVPPPPNSFLLETISPFHQYKSQMHPSTFFSIKMGSFTPPLSGPVRRDSGNTLVSSPKRSDTEGQLVESLRNFLQLWTAQREGQELQHHSAIEESCEKPKNNYFSDFPPSLPSPLPRSFRPCEIVPAVYLGSWQDIGTDAAALMQRLLQATSHNKHKTTTTTGITKNGTNISISNPPFAPLLPQQMALLIRACPLPGITSPQLELHVARPHRNGTRQRASMLGVSAGQRLTHPPMRTTAILAAVTSAVAGGDVPVPVHDVEVARIGLTELYNRVCAAVRSVGSGNDTSLPQTTLLQWLSPEAGAAPSLACGGAVPVDFRRNDWTAVVRAVQDILLADYAECTRPALPSPWREASFCYWRLVVPIADTPSEHIQPYFAMTTLILHAALSLSAHPNYAKWAVVTETGDDTNAGKERIVHGDASGQEFLVLTTVEDTPSAAAVKIRSVPCAVVHCQAGKSRSVSFVAAFLLQEWMMWYRVTHAYHAAAVPGSADATRDTSMVPVDEAQKTALHSLSEASTESLKKVHGGATARQLVDTVMSHLRSRRLCIDVNLGFDAQLYAMVNSFACSL